MSEASFKEVFELYKKQIYGYVFTLTHSSYIAEEVTQDVFIKLWLCRDTLEHIQKLDSYIFSMVHNKTLNYLRKQSNQSKLLRRVAGCISAANNNVEERICQHDYHHIINEALEKLNPRPRLIYRLSRLQGLKQDEIALLLNISSNTVRNHLSEALRSIRKYIGIRGPIVLIFTLLQFF